MKRGALLLLLLACGDPGPLDRAIASPSDVTTRVALEDVPVTGAEATVVRTDDTKATGELLEATADHVALLEARAVVSIRADDIERVIVTRYDTGAIVTALAAWSAAGGATQLTHGIFWLVSGPIWGGISAGAIVPVAADEGRFAYAERRSDLALLREYARFPQGMPAEYRRAR